jgi:hypothetical protein
MTAFEPIKLTDVSPGSTMIISPGSTMNTAKRWLSYHLVVRYGGCSGPLSYHLVARHSIYSQGCAVINPQGIGRRSFDPFKRSKDLYCIKGINEFRGLVSEGFHDGPKTASKKRGTLC